MDTQFRRWRIPVLAGICVVLVACVSAKPSPATTPTVAPTTVPAVTIVEGPGDLCQAATQVRLTVQTTEDLSAETPADWELWSSSRQLVYHGTWSVRDGALLIPLPVDTMLPPDQYQLLLTWQGQELARHVFTLHETDPKISDLAVSLTPDGPSQDSLPTGLRVVYVNYDIESACVGSPYWITVWDAAGFDLCSENGILPVREGGGVFACYSDDRGELASGDYRVEMTLMDEVHAETVFTVEAPLVEVTPSPQPSPTASPVLCTDLFAAAGITSEGEPFLPLTLFDWYTEVVFAGARCRNLAKDTVWESVWIFDGVPIREATGVWSGAPEGVVWDSLTGVVDNPFLAPGDYLVEMTVAGVPLTTTFSVFDYELRDTADSVGSP